MLSLTIFKDKMSNCSFTIEPKTTEWKKPFRQTKQVCPVDLWVLSQRTLAKNIHILFFFLITAISSTLRDCFWQAVLGNKKKCWEKKEGTRDSFPFVYNSSAMTEHKSSHGVLQVKGRLSANATPVMLWGAMAPPITHTNYQRTG